MNVVIEDESKKNRKLKILYITIIAVCIIAVIVAVSIQIIKGKETNPTPNPTLPQVDETQANTLKKEFDQIFTNKVNYLENNSYKITKVEEDKEIIYVGYKNKETKINDYELNVNIPYININNVTINKVNEEIKDVFEKKAKSVLDSKNNNVIYTVNYCGYISNNILSLVVRSTLKEGNNPQRDIVQTYNYDLTTQSLCTIDNLLSLKGITKQTANRKIRDEIKKVQETTESLQQSGYSVYPRDYTDDMYSINNVSEYFLGENNALYIIYAYGNQNNTSEMDIVVM